MKDNQLKYYGFAVLAMFFWGMTFVWTKIALEFYEPVTIIFIRLVLSSVLLFGYIRLSKQSRPIEKSDWKWFFLLALTQPFFYFIGESYGLKYVSSTIASTIIATLPIFSSLGAILFTKEKAGAFTWTGIFISFAGIVIMLVNRNLSLNAEPQGIALLFMAVFSAVLYSMVIKRLSGKYTAITILSWQNLIGALYFLPVFLIFDFSKFITVVPDYRVIRALLQLAFFGSCLAYLFFIMAIARLGMVKANIFGNLIPVFTAITAYFVIHEVFTVQKITGIFLVVFGIFVTQVRELIRLSGKSSVKSQI